MTPQEVKAWLESRSPVEFVEREILNRPYPWIFQSDTDFQDWIEAVTEELRTPRDAIKIVGSAATGVSLSPLKPGRAFRRPPGPEGIISDVDIALVDAALFTDAWNTILVHDRSRTLSSNREQYERMRRSIYKGWIQPPSVPPNTTSARNLIRAKSIFGRSPPLRGHPIRFRVYRRYVDVQAYHIQSLRELARSLS